VQDARAPLFQAGHLGSAPLPHRNQLALSFALLAALFWGLLPLALQMVVPVMDPYTITWCRFLVAGLFVGLFLMHRSSLPRPWQLSANLRWLLPAAMVGLTLNYTLFVVGVHLTSPATAQVVIQTANLFVLLGGLIVFHERFSPLQWLGAIVLLGGLLLFFNRRLPLMFGSARELGVGVVLLIIGSLTWACYGLAQKRLLREWNSAQVLWLLYVGGALLLTPLAHPSQLTIAGIWKGFDDYNASWGNNRVIAQQCGQVLLNTAAEISTYFGGTNPQLPYLQVVTWNDYEEGSAIERGLGKCDATNR